MKPLHSIQTVVDTNYFWAISNTECGFCGRTDIYEHHECAAQFFGVLANNVEEETTIYFCECRCGGLGSETHHYFVSSYMHYICGRCLANDCPKFVQ